MVSEADAAALRELRDSLLSDIDALHSQVQRKHQMVGVLDRTLEGMNKRAPVELLDGEIPLIPVDWLPALPRRFGFSVRRIRESVDLTRAQLAEMAGLADSTIRNLERGRHNPVGVTIHKVLDALAGLAPSEVSKVLLEQRAPAKSDQ